MVQSDGYWSKDKCRPQVPSFHFLSKVEKNASTTHEDFLELDQLDKVEVFLINENYFPLHKEPDQERALMFTKSCLRNIMGQQEDKIKNAVQLAKMKAVQEAIQLRRDRELQDFDDQSSSDSGGGLAPILPYHRQTYSHEKDFAPYVHVMNKFIDTFISLPQLSGLMKTYNEKVFFMCPCGGNSNVVPLWNWFPHNGYFDDVYQNKKTTCSGKKGMSFQNKNLFMNHLTKVGDIRHKLMLAYIKSVDGEKISFPYNVKKKSPPGITERDLKQSAEHNKNIE